MLIIRRSNSSRKKAGGAYRSRPPYATGKSVCHMAGRFAVAWAVLLVPEAQAVTPVWHGAPIHYAANGTPLPDVLRDVLAVEGLVANIGRDVKGVVNGRFDDTPGNVFTQLVEAYGLVWYFDGRAMHVATAAGVRSQVIPFAPMTREAVASLLRNLDLDDARLPIRYSATTARVAGPSAFVAAVAEAIDNAQRQSSAAPSYDETEIRIFPLRYAQAQDVHYAVGTREQVLPGVASLLRRVMEDTWQSTTPRPVRSRAEQRSDARAARGGPPPLPSLRGLGLAGGGRGDTDGDANADVPPLPPGAAGLPVSGGAPTTARAGRRDPLDSADLSNAADPSGRTDGPGATPARRNIVADARTNSVVINDLASMMPNYERAIAMLDQPQELVEIDAVVIDVSSNAARNLGVRWGGATGRINGASGITNAPLSFGLPALVTAPGLAAGLNLATLVGNSAQYLFAQIHALEEAGQARVLSSPQVLTLNNTEAVLTSTSSVYVRVAGNQDVDLFNIDTGLTLKVTPSVESAGDARRNIRLNIQIEDGAFNSSMSVDGIPRVDNHSIVTQAIVRDGESLLVGGYQYERSENTTSKVPVLGDVPYLGALFRDTRTSRERLERLILITPRLKRMPGDNGATLAAPSGSSMDAGVARVTAAGPAASGAVASLAFAAQPMELAQAPGATPTRALAPASTPVVSTTPTPAPTQTLTAALTSAINPAINLAPTPAPTRAPNPGMPPSVAAALQSLAPRAAAPAPAPPAPAPPAPMQMPPPIPTPRSALDPVAQLPWERRHDR